MYVQGSTVNVKALSLLNQNTVRVIVKVSAECPYEHPLPFLRTPVPIPVEHPCPYFSNARMHSSWTPVPVDIVSTPVAKVRPFW